MRAVAQQLSGKQIEDHFIPMIKRLALGKKYVIPLISFYILLSQGEWFTSRTSACGLFSVAYTLTSSPTKEDLRT